jgi:hypothetical protein
VSAAIDQVIDKVTTIAMHASQEVGSIGGAILTLRLAAEMLEGELRSHGDTPELRAFEELRPLMEEAGRHASQAAQLIHGAKVQS